MERNCLVRLIDMPRNSAYVLENFQKRIDKIINVQNINSIWLRPINYYVDEKLRMFLFYPELISLYNMLHSNEDDPCNINNILRHESIQTRIRIKLEIAF